MSEKSYHVYLIVPATESPDSKSYPKYIGTIDTALDIVVGDCIGSGVLKEDPGLSIVVNRTISPFKLYQQRLRYCLFIKKCPPLFD